MERRHHRRQVNAHLPQQETHDVGGQQHDDDRGEGDCDPHPWFNRLAARSPSATAATATGNAIVRASEGSSLRSRRLLGDALGNSLTIFS